MPSHIYTNLQPMINNAHLPWFRLTVVSFTFSHAQGNYCYNVCLCLRQSRIDVLSSMRAIMIHETKSTYHLVCALLPKKGRLLLLLCNKNSLYENNAQSYVLTLLEDVGVHDTCIVLLD